jgi:tetratricopeptide (TPR) repeat protein
MKLKCFKLLLMTLSRRRAVAAISPALVLLALLLYEVRVPYVLAQSTNDAPAPVNAPPSSLDLTPEKVSHLKTAVAEHDYIAAEKLLLDGIELDPHSPRAAPLLAYLGTVYFLNHDYLNAAIAWKKSDAIRPLASELQFSLAMAYIQISHRDWARPVIESLFAHDPKNALYPYWLGRLDYDAQHYSEATNHFQQAITLNPTMARAYDNLGLCYFYQNETGLAVKSFNRAIELDRNSQHPSAWPYLNLAVAVQFMGHAEEAEIDLRQALRLDPQLAPAHYRLGNVLQELGQLDAAVQEQLAAVRLDEKYAEPHVALAHIYNQQGRKAAAQEEVKIYLRLHASANDRDRQPPASNP